MAAQRCSLCGISYPTLSQFARCPIHGEDTSYLSNVDPDPDWKGALERMQREIEAANELRRAVPLVRGVTASEDNGLLWVGQSELIRGGVRFANRDMHLFELEDGWIYETQGWDERNRRWWVERVIRSAEGETSQRTTSAEERSSTGRATS